MADFPHGFVLEKNFLLAKANCDVKSKTLLTSEKKNDNDPSPTPKHPSKTPRRNSPSAVPSSTASSMTASPPALSPSSSMSPVAARPSSVSSSSSPLPALLPPPYSSTPNSVPILPPPPALPLLPIPIRRSLRPHLHPRCQLHQQPPRPLRSHRHAPHSPLAAATHQAHHHQLLIVPQQQPPIRLIIIDSIAALFRSEFGNSPSDLKWRSLLFFKIARKLKAQAARFGIAVVVTNQEVDLVDEGLNGLRIENYEALYSSERKVCLVPGLAWANCVNSRVFLSSEEFVNSEVWMRRKM